MRLRISRAWSLISLLLLVVALHKAVAEDAEGEGEQEQYNYDWREDEEEDYEYEYAFFKDGSAGCANNGYGLNIESFDMECDYQNNPDAPCLFDKQSLLYGTCKFRLQT